MFENDLQLRDWNPEKERVRIRCGDNLYIRGFTSGRKVFQMRIGNRWIGIGDYPEKTLTTAREITSAAKILIKTGEVGIERIKPLLLLVKSSKELVDKIHGDLGANGELLNVLSFDELYREWWNSQSKVNRWTNASSRRRVLRSYEIHAEKHIGHLRIDKIRRHTIKQFIQPLLISRTETASNLLGFIWEVFELACDRDLIDHNPCPKKASFTVPKKLESHSASLNYTRLPELWQWLDTVPVSETVKMAMRLTIVTVHRVSLVTNMQWEHFDCDTGVWNVPATSSQRPEKGRMKSCREFAIKLPVGLKAPICALPRFGKYVFSINGRKPISTETLRRHFQKFDKITTTGFRKTFKAWAFSQDPVIEPFLVSSYCHQTIAGLNNLYLSNDLFQQRAQLLEWYYNYARGSDIIFRRKQA